MKIGVALSGCDIGGVGAWALLRALQEEGFEIEMVSCCGIPAITALPYAFGCDFEQCEKLGKRLFHTMERSDLDTALAELSDSLPLRRAAQTLPIAVSAACVADGKAITFTNEYAVSDSRLATFPLEDAYDVLSATVSPADGLGSYRYRGCPLCDFSVWHGCPIQPLRLAGVSRLVAVTFLPAVPKTPFEAMVGRRIADTAGLAHVWIPVEPDSADRSLERCRDLAAEMGKVCVERICHRILR